MASEQRIVTRRNRSRWQRGFSLLIAMAIPLGVATCAAAQMTPAPLVRTAEGPVRGLVKSSIDEYLGVPYAAPPIGVLRFAPPAPPAHHNDILNATHYGASCPQAPSAFSDTADTNESCLYINIFTPGLAGKRPVMVWIHGGGLFLGSGAQYNPVPLVRQGVVVVNFNYRLGILGLLATRALSAASKSHASGNYALMDQQAAMRWVKANIGAFGGDPHNITLFGQSAGGTSVISQLIMPGSAGLFNKAIIQSAGGLGEQQTLVQAEAVGQVIAKHLGCTGNTEKVVRCLRAAPVKKIISLQTSGGTKLHVRPHITLRPDEFPTRGFPYAFRTGRFHHVPIMQGTTRYEGRFFIADGLARGFIKPITTKTYAGQIQSTISMPMVPVPRVAADRIAREYQLSKYGKGDYALSAVLTDWRACRTHRQLKNESKYVPTFAYEFAVKDPPPMLPLNPKPLPVPQGFYLGSSHLSENIFLFALPAWSGARRSDYLTNEQQDLSQAMIAYWTNFAKTGNPNHPMPVSTSWPGFSSKLQRYAKFVTPATKVITGRQFSAEHKCGFWAEQAWEVLAKAPE